MTFEKEKVDFILTHEYFAKPEDAKLFHGLPNIELKETLYQLLNRKLTNGDMTDAIRRGSHAFQTFLRDNQKLVMQQEQQELEVQKEQQRILQAEKEKINQAIFEMMLGGLVRKVGAGYHQLDIPAKQTYAETMKMVKDHQEKLKKTFLLPICATFGIKDEEKQNKIHNAALTIMYSDAGLFSVPSFKIYEESTEISAGALLCAMKYMGSVSSFNMDSDKDTDGAFIAKKEELLNSLAESYSADNGTPLETAKEILKKYLPQVIKKIAVEVL